MKLTYDPEIDALYIRLVDGKHESRCVRLSEEVALNIGEDEKLIGIEILDASSVLGRGKSPGVELDGLTWTNRKRVVQGKRVKVLAASKAAKLTH